MALKQISILKYSVAIMSHQTLGSGPKWSQGFPEPYFCSLPWPAGAALSHFLMSSLALGLGHPLSKGSCLSRLKMQSVMEASVAHSALRKGYLVSGCWGFLERWEKWGMLSHLQSCSESFSIQMLIPSHGR